MRQDAARVAVITGGAGAIGGAIAAELSIAGHTVVSLDLAGDPPVDLADEDEVRAAADRVLDCHGRCDVLVHAAAAFDRADLTTMDLAVWRRVQAVNVESALLLSQAFVPGMAARGFGRIIFVVSNTVWSPPAADMLPYVTSKGALIALARALAVGHGADGVAVTCVAPGLTDTPAARRGQPDALFEDVRSRQALPRTLVPGDVAATVAFLASGGAAALTGQTLCVDGGLILLMTGADSRVAIVTGGSGGLGGAVAARLRADGFRVASADIDVPSGDASAGDAAVQVDVTDPDSAAAMCAWVLDRWGRVDVLVNNAGIAGPTAPVASYPPDAWHRVIAVNLFGVFHCTRACLPYMTAAGYGRIVNVASIAGKDGNPEMSAYSASKAGVIAFTKSVAKEVARAGVLVNCVVPGVIDAGLTDRAPEEERRLFLSRIPMGRMGQPAELAELVSWLASERCSFSTGAAFDLSGGRAVY